MFTDTRLRKEPYKILSDWLESHGVQSELKPHALVFMHHKKELRFCLADDTENSAGEDQKVIHLDQLMRAPLKIAAIILSRLHLNQTVFARNGEVRKVDKSSAVSFLEEYHIMGATQSGSNLGLFYKSELIALASFSKGRKMNRLKSEQRSFELIRFCCKSGITVTGGLTKLVKHFCEEKKAGDVMTYVDKQLSDGRSFISAGFKKYDETEPNYFLVKRATFERIPWKKDEKYDTEKFYLSHNAGNIKLIYTP